MTLLESAKAVCRVTSSAFDDEIQLLIEASIEDMGVADINEEVLDAKPPIVRRAIMTYVSMNFKLNNGQIDTMAYERLKESYDEQKRQMAMSSEYGNLGGRSGWNLE